MIEDARSSFKEKFRAMLLADGGTAGRPAGVIEHLDATDAARCDIHVSPIAKREYANAVPQFLGASRTARAVHGVLERCLRSLQIQRALNDLCFR